jgi:hypothetical protein
MGNSFIYEEKGGKLVNLGTKNFLLYFVTVLLFFLYSILLTYLRSKTNLGHAL